MSAGLHEPPLVTNLRARGLYDLVARHAHKHGLTVHDLVGRSRVLVVVNARAAAWRDLVGQGIGQAEIATLFGRDQSTVSHALNAVRRERELAGRRLLWRRTTATPAQMARTALRVI